MPAPVADFSFSPAFGPAVQTVQFTDLSTNSPTSWTWIINPGDARPAIIRNEQNPVVALNVGRWAVTLIVGNADGVSQKVVGHLQGPHITAPA